MRPGAGFVARTVRSLHHPNYRRYLAGHALSIVGTWMQRVAQDWLVLELTGTPSPSARRSAPDTEEEPPS